jgi:exonuclease VII large subunit
MLRSLSATIMTTKVSAIVCRYSRNKTTELYRYQRCCRSYSTSRPLKRKDDSTSSSSSWWNSILETGTQKVRENADKALESSTKYTKDITNQASKIAVDTLTKSKQTFEDKLQQTSQQLQEKATKTLQDTSKAVGQRTHRLYKDTSHTVQEKTKQTIQQTKTNINRSSQNVVNNVTSVSRVFGKYALWWSLAAVFVYGIATTLPIQLIKYSMEGKNNNNTKNNTGSSSNDDQSSSSSSSPSSLWSLWTQQPPPPENKPISRWWA